MAILPLLLPPLLLLAQLQPVNLFQELLEKPPAFRPRTLLKLVHEAHQFRSQSGFGSTHSFAVESSFDLALALRMRSAAAAFPLSYAFSSDAKVHDTAQMLRFRWSQCECAITRRDAVCKTVI
jgi:hypothetical protein